MTGVQTCALPILQRLEKANWGEPAPGRYQGVALVNNLGSFTAEVAEVSLEGGKVKVHRVVCAIDCGQVVNPAIVKQQVEGGIAYGLTAALKGPVTVYESQQSLYKDGLYSERWMAERCGIADVQSILPEHWQE